VLRLASVVWRLRRATAIETALFESVMAKPGQLAPRCSGPALVAGTDPSQRDRIRLAAIRQSNTAPARELGLDANSTIADSFLRLAGLPTYPLDWLSRYEYMLWRQANQIMFMLESLGVANEDLLA
jgi:hypothetical protein